MPIRGRLGERTLERPRHPWRRPGPHGGDGRRSRGQMLPHHALHRRPRERRLPGEHLVHHACEAIEVTPAVQLAAPGGLLRTHVRGRPHSEPGFGQPVAARGVDRSGDPEVAHHRVARLEQDILRLDVAVDDVVTVREAQGVRHLARDPHGIVHRQLPLTGQAITPLHFLLEISGGLDSLTRAKFAGRFPYLAASPRETPPSGLPREKAKPAEVVASALKPSCPR